MEVMRADNKVQKKVIDFDVIQSVKWIDITG